MNTATKLPTTLLCAVLVCLPATLALAADEHAGHHEAEVGTAIATVATAESSPAAMSSMKKMQEQMAAIRATQDTAQRAKLMDKHMKTMQATAQLMQQDKGCAMMGNGGGMNMMQMMMEQMMQHQQAMQGSGK